MRTVLHIGSPKTGTTTLQRCLLASKKTLRALGVLYPRPPGGEKTHAVLLRGLFHPEHMPRIERHRPADPRARERFLNELGAEIAASRPAALVLSYEGFFRLLPAAALPTIRHQLESFGTKEITIAAYLRRPSEYYLSALQQSLKASATPKPPATENLRAVLEPYGDVFGEQNLRVRRFHRESLEEGDIISDFVRNFLPEAAQARAELAKPGRVNESMSAEAMDILRRYRQSFHPDEDGVFRRGSTRLHRQLSELDRHLGLPRPRLRPDVAEAIDHQAVDLPWLRERHGVEFPGIDYGKIAPPPPVTAITHQLEDLVVIDPEARRVLAEALAASPWATEFTWRDLPRLVAGGASRRSWVARLAAEFAHGGRR